jgi:hypothetical protein
MRKRHANGTRVPKNRFRRRLTEAIFRFRVPRFGIALR